MSDTRSSACDRITLRVVIHPEKTSAQLVIPAEFDRKLLTPAFCLSFLQQAGVEAGDQTRRSLVELIDRAKGAKEEVRGEVAFAVEPVHSEDGYVEWTVDGQKSEDAAAPTSGGPDHVSFYDKSAFVTVKAGDVIGQVHSPTPAEDGRDVTGRTLVARVGREAKLKIDETLIVDAAGRIIAQAEGVLYRKDDQASVRQQIVIDQYVDFSTGNVDFNGDVLVRKGVRDCFIVKASGNVEVHGLIEAATIIAGKDLIAAGGFAGRERGHATIGRDLRGKYLDNVQGEVKQNLCVDREVINCDLLIHGAIESPHGTLIGGRFTITGRVSVAQIGSGADVPTVLVIGSVPRLEPLQLRLHDLLSRFEQHRGKLVEEQTLLNNLTKGRRATSDQKERQTEIMFEMMQADNALMKGTPTLNNLTYRIEQQRTVEVLVERKLCAGVRLVFAGNTFRIKSEQRGPVRIRREGGRLVYQQGDGPAQPIAQIADVETVGR